VSRELDWLASIDRTAYPRFKRHPSAAELRELYTPTDAELAWATATTAKRPASTLALLVLLKGFQRLGYLPRLADVPPMVVAHVRACARLGAHIKPEVSARTLYRHHHAVRLYLDVTGWGAKARHVAVTAVAEAAEVRDRPADLVNVAIEELVRGRFELPAFSTLDRLARRVRAVVNQRLFTMVSARLTAEQARAIDELLDPPPAPPGQPRRQARRAYHRLKQPPKRPTLSNFEELLAHLAWLETFGDPSRLLGGVPSAKVTQFAAEAKALDAAELNDHAPAKRRMLVLCRVARAQVTCRDDVAEMFGKRIAKFHQRAREELDRIRAAHRQTTEGLMATFAELLAALKRQPGLDDASTGRLVRQVITPRGGVEALLADCEAVAAYHGDNYLPLIHRFYASHRRALFDFARQLQFTPTSADRSLLDALEVLLANQHRKGQWLAVDAGLDLGFASEQWQRTVIVRSGPAGGPGGALVVDRRHFEVCLFTHLAHELRSGDLAIEGADSYADYRQQLLSWQECEPQVVAYCRQLGLPETAEGLVEHLRGWLAGIAADVDAGYPANAHVTMTEQGEPILKRPARAAPSPSAQALEAALSERLPERNLLDILSDTAHWTGWPRHFGPLSGSEPKLVRPVERYLLTTFAYGTNLGPVQAARHLRGAASAHALGFTNRRHVTAATLEAAHRDLINAYHQCALPRLWGDPKVAAADGTKYDLVADSLLAEYHIRYGGYGGIAYHHIADTYVALFSHFIPCGVWEAIYLIDGLLKNTSDIQPDTVHADTQGQSTTVFALAWLLGIKLMPRIRNWKHLVFYRPDPAVRYRHIDALFGEPVDWDKIATHWQDLLRVVLSIKAGKISSAVLLRKLGTYSRKNRLYQAFRELGRVARTAFLLQFLADQQLREQITASTNKVEAYNGFAKWLFFGGQTTAITDPDPQEQEKRIKYNDLVANAVMLHNVHDMTTALHELAAEGYPVHPKDLAALSPYATHNIKRFGDYLLPPPDHTPGPFNGDLRLHS